MLSSRDYYLNKDFVTNEGYKVTIIEYVNSSKVTILFENGYTTIVQISNLKKGTTKNPLNPNVCGVGYVGIGRHKVSEENKVSKKYKVWNSMLRRCYSSKSLVKQITYTGCSVDERWHNFQIFAEWFEDNYIEGFTLDKDIIFKGNKIYSPETCCFVPQEINTIFTKRQNDRGSHPIGVTFHKSIKKYAALLSIGAKQVHLGVFSTPEEAFQVYRTSKESYIKEVAKLWKEKITVDCYQALINYKVEITD